MVRKNSMAPRGGELARGGSTSSSRVSRKRSKYWYENYLDWREWISLLTDQKKLLVIGRFVILFEIILNVLVIERVRYTEIDWQAYMQEVEGFLNGTYDYSKLKGDTGPLVYPAGFVYIFSGLYYLTGRGLRIKIAQYLFAALYSILVALVFRIYARTRTPPYLLILMCCTSYRIHSIFVLRLFNDPIAMILLFASINAFLDDRWYVGSILYSCAVSVKMNILLFAPALLIGYLCNLGVRKTVIHLSLCALIQLILALPFLLENPIAYVEGAFNFGRVFEFKWTVNWRFLPEHVFISSYFHAILLFCHIATLIYCASRWINYMKVYANLKQTMNEMKPGLRQKYMENLPTISTLFILPMFAANFIGMTFSRSLHYQFYIWYYHTLPFIAWCTEYKTITKLTILGFIELCWNVYPSTIYSSAALHACHLLLLSGLLRNKTLVT